MPDDGAQDPEQLVVEAHTRRCTALVALRGELDLGHGLKGR